MENFESLECQNNFEKGRNINIVISFLRHGEKDSKGELTDAGHTKSEELGEQKELPKDGIKLYASPFHRTASTMEAIMQGIERQQVEKKIFNPRHRITLAPPEWEHFDHIAKKAKEMEEKEGHGGVFRYMMTESLAQKDLERWSSALAYMINQYRKGGHRFYSGSDVELQHITHDTVIGDFLRKVAIFKDEDGQRIEKVNFDNLGGPINFLEGFSFVVNIDNESQEHFKIIFRGEELEVDENKFKELVNFYKEKPHKGRVSKQDYKSQP